MKKVLFLVAVAASLSIADRCEIMILYLMSDIQIQQSKISYVNAKVNYYKMQHEHCLAIANGDQETLKICEKSLEKSDELFKSLASSLKEIKGVEKELTKAIENDACKNEQ